MADPDDNVVKRVLEMPLWVVPSFFVGVLALLGVLSLLFPTFYEQVVWKYLFGPMKATVLRQSTATYNGVVAETGYNVGNTLFNMFTLATWVVWSAQVVTRHGVKTRALPAFGIAGWVAAGAVFHVHQDARLFAVPLEYAFLTPYIYLMFFGFAIGFHFLGRGGERLRRRHGDAGPLGLLAGVLAAGVLAWTVGWYTDASPLRAWLHPGWVAAFAAVGLGLVAWDLKRHGRVVSINWMTAMHVPFLLLAMGYVVKWVWGTPWVFVRPETSTLALAAAPVTLAILLAVWAIGRAWQDRTGAPEAVTLVAPLNLLVVGSQVVDGVVTGIGIDIANYSEKQVVSGLVIDGVQDLSAAIGFDLGVAYPTLVGFVPLKIAIGLLAVYAIDEVTRGDGREVVAEDGQYPLVEYAVKIGVVLVSLGPGLRNMARAALGV